MTEWGVVGVLVVLIGLIASIVKPMLTLNTSIVQLTTKLASLTQGLDDFKKRYVDNLHELKDADKHMNDKIDDHENRITKLEDRVEFEHQ